MDDPKKRTLCLLVEANGRKGATVIDRIAEDRTFCDHYQLSVVTDGDDGRAVNIIEKHGLEYTSVDRPEDPAHAIHSISNSTDGLDYLICCGWGYKIPREVLDIPAESLNCHSSYLPEYRGLSVYRVQWANAESEGGVSVHRMTEDFDSGEIVAQQRYSIGLFDTPLSMCRTYAELSASLIRESVFKLDSGYESVEQGIGGEYYTKLPWWRTILHGVINRAFRGIGSDRRWQVHPTEVKASSAQTNQKGNYKEIARGEETNE